MPKLVKVPEAADMLCISEKTLWSWVGARRIGVVRIGRAVRVSTTTIEELIERGTTPARVA